MDPTSLAAAFINAQFGQVQAGAALKILQMGPHDATLARTLVAIAQNAIPISNLAQGVGQNIDVTA
jgi:hypothetical protein